MTPLSATAFTLAPTSPVIRRGVPISGIATAPADMGAEAFVSVVTPINASVLAANVRAWMTCGMLAVAIQNTPVVCVLQQGCSAHPAIGGTTLIAVSVTVRALSGVA